MCLTYFPLQGVSLIDIDKDGGENAVKLLKEEFDEDKIIFIKADVINKDEYERKKTR